MNLIEYTLFRIKFIQSRQLTLPFELDTIDPRSLPPPALFKAAVEEKPTIQTKQDAHWHLGNIEPFTPEAGSFAIGKTTITSLSKYDPQSGNFVEEAFEASPYTFCVYHLGIGLVAIAKKTSLAADTTGIAEKLSALLSSTRVVKSNNVSVVIDPISDPKDFLRRVSQAYAVTKFKAWFTGPNPMDADKLFQRPLSVYCQEVAAERGSVEVEGKELDKGVIADVATSTAATGNDAAATVIDKKGMRSQRIRMRRDNVKKSYPADIHDRRKVAEDMPEEYGRIRARSARTEAKTDRAALALSDESGEGHNT